MCVAFPNEYKRLFTSSIAKMKSLEMHGLDLLMRTLLCTDDRMRYLKEGLSYSVDVALPPFMFQSMCALQMRMHY